MSINDIREEQVSILTFLVELYANGEQDIVETFKGGFGDTRRSTGIGYAFKDLKTAMLNCGNVTSLVQNFARASEKVNEKGVPVLSFEKVKDLCERNLRIDNPVSKSLIPEHNRLFIGSKKGIREYKKLGVLGSGAGGTVEEVEYKSETFTKKFAKKTCDNIGIEKERFVEEILTLSKMDHSGIISIVDGDLESDSPWYVMELIQGTDLSKWKGSFLEKIQLFSELLDAVSYLHKKDLVHRDLKPQNIMVRRSDCRPVIVDFGTAYKPGQKSRTCFTPGTPNYQAPESIEAKCSRSKSLDIFACGIIAYELLMEFIPNYADYCALSLPEENPTVVSHLDRVIQKAIQGTVTLRYQNVEKMKADWDLALGRAEEKISPEMILDIDWKMRFRTRIALVENKMFEVPLPELFLSKFLTEALNNKVQRNAKTSIQVFKMTRLMFLEHHQGEYSFFGAKAIYANDEEKYESIDSVEIFSMLNSKFLEYLSQSDLNFGEKKIEWKHITPGSHIESGEYYTDRDELLATPLGKLNESFIEVSVQSIPSRFDQSFSDDEIPF